MTTVQPRQRDIRLQRDALLVEGGTDFLVTEDGGKLLVAVRRVGARDEFEHNRESED